MGENAAYAELGADAKKKQIERVINSEQFKFMKKNMSYAEMAKLSEKHTPDVLKAWKGFGEKMLKKENETLKEHLKAIHQPKAAAAHNDQQIRR